MREFSHIPTAVLILQVPLNCVSDMNCCQRYTYCSCLAVVKRSFWFTSTSLRQHISSKLFTELCNTRQDTLISQKTSTCARRCVPDLMLQQVEEEGVVGTHSPLHHVLHFVPPVPLQFSQCLKTPLQPIHSCEYSFKKTLVGFQ